MCLDRGGAALDACIAFQEADHYLLDRFDLLIGMRPTLYGEAILPLNARQLLLNLKLNNEVLTPGGGTSLMRVATLPTAKSSYGRLQPAPAWLRSVAMIAADPTSRRADEAADQKRNRRKDREVGRRLQSLL
jgi:hypothetical protein